MSNADMVQSSALYVAVLAAGEPSPLAPESDEENDAEIDEADEEDDEEDTEASSKDGDNGDDEAKEKERGEGQAKKDGDKKVSPPAPVTIDFEDLSQRILALPVPSSEIVDLEAGVEGVLFYRRRSGPQAPWQLYRFSLEEREEKSLLEEVDGFDLSADGKKLLFVSGGKWEIADAKDKIERGKAPLAIDAVRVWMEPRAEWQQIYDEAWRINRDYFYDPGMHGEDWPGMREQYAQFLPDLATRADLNRVLQWMSSELAVGHHRVGGGDRRARPESVPGGLLGCDFAVDTSVPGGRYRFERVFGGLNWNPELRAPLTEPGVEVRPGEYLLAVDGRPLDATENVYARFESTANRIVTIEVGSDPQGSDARTVEVVPIESEAALRNRAWIEGNLRRVEEATQGRVAYVYVPNTTRQGHEYFKRYFYAQVDKEAVIVDERFNGGGQVADYVIDLLRRPYISNWATRYGADLRTPSAAILGPKVMLIDETAGSGGDLLPWMFHKLEIGTLVGKRTWGGLVGILGFPVLMDGGVITAPNLAIWTEDGFVVENEGVPPDVEVEQWPAEIIAGRDPQLEKAIEIALEELERNPPPAPAKPPYPLRARP
jgi:tricorn protease